MSSISNARKTNMSKPSRAKMSLTVQYAVARRGLPTTDTFRRWARAALFEDASVTLRLVGEGESRALNAAYRGRHYPTNVLTFPYRDGAPLSGDIALCIPLVRREASRQGKSLKAHLAHLTVHGMLHLQGYEHQAPLKAELMEGLETEIVAKLGYPDPYRTA